jgi:phospholipase C
MMKRRDALKTIGGLAGAAGMARFLPGCGGGGGDGPVGITTYVYLMMENRSYDHFFGSRKLLEGLAGDGLVDTFTNKNLAGDPVGLWAPTVNQLCDLDPPHGWDASRAAFNNGLCDGFVTQHQMDHGDSLTAIEPMQYLTRTDVPVSYALADAYTTCDRWFCSVMGPTWPNRFFWHSADSGGQMTNSLPSEGINWPSIYHRLEAKGVDWAYYYGSIPVVALIKDIPNIDLKIKRFTQFLKDAADGVLPPVVYIDPGFNFNDDHPPIHPINGQDLIASIYTALATSPQWKNIMFLVTYDEHGGFFDHVPPPKTVDQRAAIGFDQLGFRVPTMVMGPYVKQNYVSSVVYEHCSALRHLELAFDLEPLNARTMASNDLTDCIDLERLAAGEPADPIEIPLVNIGDWPMDASCTSSARELHCVEEWANAHPEVVGTWDLRRELPEYGATIRNYLRRKATVR